MIGGGDVKETQEIAKGNEVSENANNIELNKDQDEAKNKNEKSTGNSNDNDNPEATDNIPDESSINSTNQKQSITQSNDYDILKSDPDKISDVE